MRATLGVVLGLVAAVAHAANDLAPQPFQGDLNHGKQVYEQHCQSCHGLNGIGDASQGPRLADSGRLSGWTNEKMLELLRPTEATKSRKKTPAKQAHFRLPSAMDLLDVWDVVGFVRARTIEVQSVFPEMDRYLVYAYAPDDNGLERIAKTVGAKPPVEEATLTVVTAYKTGWGGRTELLPMDPKVLDKLKRNMKVGYMVTVPLFGQPKATDVVLALDVKSFAISSIHGIAADGARLPELDKQLERFLGKGDRRLSGQVKTTLKAGGGGKDFKLLEPAVTQAFVYAAEAVTAYEVQERERSWADDDL
jgi:hypothetical protein